MMNLFESKWMGRCVDEVMGRRGNEGAMMGGEQRARGKGYRTQLHTLTIIVFI